MERTKCIVSVAFREPYITHSDNQIKVILNQDLETAVLRYANELPTKDGIVKDDIVSHFQKSLYGFKPHAIQVALNAGYKHIIWFDPSVKPESNVSDLFAQVEKTDMLIVKGDKELSDMTSDKAYDWFGLKKEDTKGIKHIGGTIYCFNFNNPKTVEVFNLWKKAEEEGIFGTQDEFMAGHWADESCMALAMFKCGVEQKSVTFDYKNQKEL